MPSLGQMDQRRVLQGVQDQMQKQPPLDNAVILGELQEPNVFRDCAGKRQKAKTGARP
jgi:hypothetical protein